MEFEFRYLRDFLAVIESGSLGDAARRLKTSQPTLTRSVKLLEQAVGGAVFDRTPQGMRPTALGRALERRARLIMGEIASTRRELDDLIEARRGKVVVGTGPLFASFILPRAIARFQAAHPHVDVAIVQSPMRETLAALRAGEIDCTFHSAPEALSQELTHRVLLRGQKGVIVTRSDNPLAARRRLTLKELAQEPWMMPPRPDYFRQRFEAVFTRAGVAPPEPVIEYNSVVGVTNFLLERRRLLSVLYDPFIAPEAGTQRLVALNVPEFSWAVTSSVIFRRESRLSPAAAKMVESVRAVCAEQMRR